MEVTAQIRRDHPVDIKQFVSPGPGLPGNLDHLFTLVPVQFRGTTVKVCFVGRGDITFLRAGARNENPPPSAERRPARYTNLAMTLKPGDKVAVGPGLMDLTVISVGRGHVLLCLGLRSPGLILNLEPLSETQHLDLRQMIDRLNRGEDYRSDAL